MVRNILRGPCWSSLKYNVSNTSTVQEILYFLFSAQVRENIKKKENGPGRKVYIISCTDLLLNFISSSETLSLQTDTQALPLPK